MKVPVPLGVSRHVSTRATQLAKAYGEARGWRSSEGLEPVIAVGEVGIRSPYKHLVFQDQGTRPRLMTELEGKVIPMGDGRYVRVKGVGTPGFVTLPGGVRVWRDQKWRHPGIKPTHFMQKAIEKAVYENKGLIKMNLKNVLGTRSPRRQIGATPWQP